MKDPTTVPIFTPWLAASCLSRVHPGYINPVALIMFQICWRLGENDKINSRGTNPMQSQSDNNQKLPAPDTKNEKRRVVNTVPLYTVRQRILTVRRHPTGRGSTNRSFSSCRHRNQSAVHGHTKAVNLTSSLIQLVNSSCSTAPSHGMIACGDVIRSNYHDEASMLPSSIPSGSLGSA